MSTIDTGTQELLASKENGVGILTMNRPEARNAMSGEMNAAMQEMLAQFETDTEIRCVVLTGAGKGFCAGGDVKGMAASGDGTVGTNTIDSAIHRQRVHQRATSGKLFKMPKPTIASLPGAAAGAGLSYALACDLRIMASNAILTTAFARVGFSGDYGGSYFYSFYNPVRCYSGAYNILSQCAFSYGLMMPRIDSNDILFSNLMEEAIAFY